MFKEIEDFLNYLIHERGLSDNTIKSYKHQLHTFATFAHLAGIKEFVYVNCDIITKFIGDLKSKGFEATTQRLALAALKSLFKFLVKEKIVQSNLLCLISRPKIWKKTPKVLTHNEIDLILSLPDDSDLGLLEKAILELLYGSGLRVSELCNLKVKDLNKDFVKVYGKGLKERIVPVSKYFYEAIHRYWKRCHKNAHQNDYIFLCKNKKLTRNYVWKIIKKYKRLGNIEKNISPNTFRHTFAVHMLNGGADMRIIQDLLGHESIDTTAIYLGLSLNDIVDKFRKYHLRYAENDEEKKDRKIYEIKSHLKEMHQIANECGKFSVIKKL